MKNDTKQGLLKAGFKENGEGYILTRNYFNILINESISLKDEFNLNVIYTITGEEITNNVKFKSLEELNKICYGYILQDLNFEAKKYTWAECLNTKNGFYIRQDSSIDQLTRNDIESDSVSTQRNVVPTRENAESIDATTQLMQICAKINEDFEQTDEYFYFPVLYGGKLTHEWNLDVVYNQFKMKSVLAVKTLIETNSPLLMKYFENQPF